MCRWQVSEPFISLWLLDEPLGYESALGPRISFSLYFKQREDVSGYDTNIFSVGPRWNLSWLSYVTLSDTNNTVFFPGGGSRQYYSTLDYLTNTRLGGTTNSGFSLTNSDGSKTVFGLVVTNASGNFRQAFMTEEWNAVGQRTRFQYAAYDPTNPVVRLKFVVDGDGNTNSIYYVSTNNYSTNLISYVVDPFSRTNFLYYNTNGLLTNITDVIGLPSTFTYDSSNWVNAMTTPYGTTSFQFTDDISTNTAPHGRSVLVTEPDSGKHLYQCFYGVLGSPTTYPTNMVPNTAPFTNTLDTASLHLRNTFYWGPRQYAALSTTNIGLFTTNDYRRARMRHWLKTGFNGITSTLSLERQPSPDGVIEGQLTWFDHAHKPLNNAEGSQVLPLFVAQVLPDGTNQFIRTLRNDFGAVTNEVSTYSSGGTVALRTNKFKYAANWIDLIVATNALGVQVESNVYNAFHQVLTNFNALGEKTFYTYDSSNRVSSVTYPNGLVVTNIYEATNFFLSQQVITGIATNTFTHSNNLVRTHTDPRGLRVTNTWDALQRLVRKDFSDGTFILNAYDKLDFVRTVDRMGLTNSFGYDALGRTIAATNALGHYELFDYCACGSLNWARDAGGNFTYFYYDNAGRLTNTVFPDGYAVTNRFDLMGRLTNALDNAGGSLTNWFNNQGLRIAASNAVGRLETIICDALDRPTNVVGANGVNINATFDNLDRILTRSYPDNGTELFDYTANIAGVTSYTNQLGSNVVNYSYDLLGRKTNEVYPGITTNKFSYSAAGDLRTLTDGKGQVASWGYDIFGHVLSKTNAANLRVFTNAYDANGRLTNHWTPAKGLTGYSYDPVGNLTNVNYTLSPDLSFQYDALNRCTSSAVAGVITNLRSFDAVGQLLTEDGPWLNDAITHTYSNRLHIGLSLQQPSGTWTNGFTFDGAKRLKTLLSPAGTFDWTYDPLTHCASRLSLPNGSFITNRFDSVARLSSTQLKTSGGLIRNSHVYQYDLAGQRTNHTRTDGSFVEYTYDLVGQLKTALGKEFGGATNRLQEQLGYSRTNGPYGRSLFVWLLEPKIHAQRDFLFE